MGKTRLGVIFGSRSCEREVSIISAVQLMRHADPEKYDVIPVYISPQGIWYTGEKLKDIRVYRDFSPQNLPSGVERVIFDTTAGSGALLATHGKTGLFTHTQQVVAARMDVAVLVMHGLNGEDGTLQGMMELANIPYTSTGVAGSSLGMDKIMIKYFFQGAGLPVLPGTWYTRTRWQAKRDSVMDDVEKVLGYPVFVKPANLGSSIGVSPAGSRQELGEALDLAFEYDRRVLVEKGLDRPIELNCSVLGYDETVEASPIEMPVISSSNMLDFQEKYIRGGGSKGMAGLSRVLPAPIGEELTGEIQELSRRIFRLLDCKGVVRIDYMFDRASEKVYITEINTIPGSLAFYLWEAGGLSYAGLIDRMVEHARKAWDDRNERNYAYTSDILSSVSLGTKGAKGGKTGKI